MSAPDPAAPAAEAAVASPLTYDPVEAMRLRGKSPELAAVLAWLIPGAGHLYAGYRIKGFGALVLLLGLFVAGLALSGCECVSLRAEGGHEYAFVAQVGAGLPTLFGLAYTHGKLPGSPAEPPDMRSREFAVRFPAIDTGLLLTMVAGLLNLLMVHDALSGVPGGLARRREEAMRRRRLDALRAELAAKADEPAADADAPAGEADEPAAVADEPAAEAAAPEEPA